MNRRNFLKTTGIISILGLSNISFAKNKKELKWISLKDEMPKIGQKIILIGKHINYISLGTLRYPCKMYGSKKDYITICLDEDINRIKHGQQDAWIYSIHSEQGYNILKTKKWLGYYDKPSYIKDFQNIQETLRNSKYEGITYHKRGYYWTPVEGEYPDEIPNFPAKSD